MKKIGIYKITNVINNKCYIGSSKNLDKRWYEHKRRLKKGNHHSILLQRAHDKYGTDNFIYEILCECLEDELLIKEQEHFDRIQPEYIILKQAGRVTGYRHSKETKQKLREARAKQTIVITDETKKKISDANKGKLFSDEHKKKLSVAKKGKILSDEHKENIRKTINIERMREIQIKSVIARKQNKIKK